ncbi:hypothetical protein ACXYMX_00525 [Sporosarcina sp. CAU 1771]
MFQIEINQTDYHLQLTHLENLINTVQSNVHFTITIALTIILASLTIAVAIAGAALFILAKKWVTDSAQEKSEEMKEYTKTLVAQEIADYFESSTYVIPAGITGFIPFELEKVDEPSVFVWYKNQQPQCVISVSESKIFLENETNEDISIDLLVIGAKLRYKGPHVWDASI